LVFSICQCFPPPTFIFFAFWGSSGIVSVPSPRNRNRERILGPLCSPALYVLDFSSRGFPFFLVSVLFFSIFEEEDRNDVSPPFPFPLIVVVLLPSLRTSTCLPPDSCCADFFPVISHFRTGRPSFPKPDCRFSMSLDQFRRRLVSFFLPTRPFPPLPGSSELIFSMPPQSFARSMRESPRFGKVPLRDVTSDGVRGVWSISPRHPFLVFHWVLARSHRFFSLAVCAPFRAVLVSVPHSAPPFFPHFFRSAARSCDFYRS